MTPRSACIGVDPGASGAVALVSPTGALLAVEDMPSFDGLVSGALLSDVVGDMVLMAPQVHALVERVGSMPGQGVSSTFKFGRAVGCVDGVIAARGVPIGYVTPAKWKAAAGLSKDKSASRRLATELWPAQAHLFSRVKDDGRAEAALIARHGWLRGT